MQQIRPIRHTMLGASLALGLVTAFAGCSPAPTDTGGSSGTGGSAPSGSGGTASGTGGTTSGAGGATGTGGGGGSSATGGSAPGTGGSGTGGSATGTGGSAPGTGGNAPGTGGAGTDAAGEAGSPDASSATPTFTQVFTEILNPGCTGAGNACHSVVRDGYFHFAMKGRAYELLVPMAPRVGTVPPRVMVLINHVVPKNPNDPNSVDMPPQSGPNLGNPPTRKPPLTAAQVAMIRAWALAGAKND